jgi:hypothetical protein
MKFLIVCQQIPANLAKLSPAQLKKVDEEYKSSFNVGQGIGGLARSRDIELVASSESGSTFTGSAETGYRTECRKDPTKSGEPDALILINTFINSKGVENALKKYSKSIKRIILYSEEIIVNTREFEGKSVIPAGSLPELAKVLENITSPVSV